MPFFQVDDQFHSHPKTAWLSDGAVALWTRAGSHCAAYLTDGFVDDAAVRRLGGKKRAIDELLTIRPPHASPLWIRVEGGYQFHDWDQYQPTAEEVKQNRRKARERMKTVRANKGRTLDDGSQKVRIAQSNPSHSIPINKTDTSSPVLETGASGPDESESVEAICIRQAAALGVDFAKVKTAIGKACGRFPDPSGVVRIIATVLERAKPPVKSPTGLVLAAVRDDWAEWQQMLDEAVA